MLASKLEAEEALRLSENDSIQTQVDRGVAAEIAARDQLASKTEAQTILLNTNGARGNTLAQAVVTEQPRALSGVMGWLSRVFNYLFLVIYSLLIIRLLLAVFAPDSNAGFVQLINMVTDPLYAPFRGIVTSPGVAGWGVAVPIVLAIVAFALLHLAVNGFLRLFARRKVTIY